jgi:ElaB/YqjD/DUF883 family membrane-anchored ribosome-binding protein
MKNSNKDLPPIKQYNSLREIAMNNSNENQSEQSTSDSSNQLADKIKKNYPNDYSQANEKDNQSSLMKKGEQTLKNIKDEAGNKIEKAVEEVKNKSAEVRTAIAGYIKEHPFLSLGWVLLAGAAIGAMLRK